MVIYMFLMMFMVLFVSLVSLMSSMIELGMVVFGVSVTNLGWGSIKLFFHLDLWAVGFMLVVVLVTLVVMVFSLKYMQCDGSLSYFMILLVMFVLGMMILVVSGSFVVTYLGWDILGIVSFLLIAYYGNYSSVGGSLITVMMNRVGDCLMVVLLVWLMMVDHEVSGTAGLGGMSFLVGLVLVMAAITKSAQFPYYVWLPMAMAAPTPVSALVHSSTLVTAGVYLLVRWWVMLEESSLVVLFIVSMVTIIYSGLMLMSEEDMKKMVALSTLMHLGIMMCMVSIGSWYDCYIHMLMHAIYKSMLFVAVGLIILMKFHDQSVKVGSGIMFAGVGPVMMLVVSVLSLIGLPYFTGFYSKELVLMVLFSGSLNSVGLLMGLVGLSFSLLYCVRLLGLLSSGVVQSSLVCVMGNSSVSLVALMVYSVYCLMGVAMGYSVFMGLSGVFSFVSLGLEEVLIYYGLMGVVCLVFFGFKVGWCMNLGYMVDLISVVLLDVVIKLFTMVVVMESVLVGWGVYKVVLSGVNMSGWVVWTAMLSSLVVYGVSLLMVVFMVMVY